MESKNQSQDKHRTTDQNKAGNTQDNARQTKDESKKTDKPHGEKRADADRRGAGK